MTNQMKVFISYAHEDEKLCKKLKVSLEQILEKENIWSDSQIIAGSEWDENIRQNLKNAQIVLLLISPDFIASRYITEVEVKEAMERHTKNEARIIPIILRPAYWEDRPYSKLEALPKDGKPVTKWDNPDDPFLDIVTRIKQAIDQLNAAQAGVNSLSAPRKAEIRFHEALLKLDFNEQKDPFHLFSAIEDKEHLGAFIIHGPPDHGQVWLVNRLIKAAEIENVDKGPFTFAFAAKGRSMDMKSLWNELDDWLDDSNSSQPAKSIVEQAYNLWQRQSVILKIRGIQYARREDIEAFLQTFWEPLMKMIADRLSQGQKSPDHYLLLFLVDDQGEVEQWQNNWKGQFEVPSTPVKLKKIQKFKYKDIKSWIEGNKDDLPHILTPQNAVAEGYIPELALMQICTVCGYEWFKQEGVKW